MAVPECDPERVTFLFPDSRRQMDAGFFVRGANNAFEERDTIDAWDAGLKPALGAAMS